MQTENNSWREGQPTEHSLNRLSCLLCSPALAVLNLLHVCDYRTDHCSFLKLFFNMSHLTIYFIELVTILVLFFGLEACRILAPCSGIGPTIPALEGKVLTTGLLGKPPSHCYR